MTSNIYLGRYQDTLAEHTWDALICDPPYSEKTHTGHNLSTTTTSDLEKQLARMEARAAAGLPVSNSRSSQTDTAKIQAQRQKIERSKVTNGIARRLIEYKPWEDIDVAGFVEWAHPRTRGWMVCMCDNILAPAYAAAMESQGRYVFAPVVWYSPGSRFRMVGDGPSCWSVWIVVSRPKGAPFATWGSLPGGYCFTTHGTRSNEEQANYIGGKPISLMRALVRDYSRPGDTVCDPCAGWGTTPVAARAEGRSYLASEMDPAAYEVARARLEEPLPLFAATQGSLLEPNE